jgi:hypothetical protein
MSIGAVDIRAIGLQPLRRGGSLLMPSDSHRFPIPTSETPKSSSIFVVGIVHVPSDSAKNRVRRNISLNYLIFLRSSPSWVPRTRSPTRCTKPE